MLTQEEAIAALVEKDVAKWGESEREASRAMRRQLSHGQALNSLAHYDSANIDKAMAAQAKKIMTSKDRAELRKGG